MRRIKIFAVVIVVFFFNSAALSQVQPKLSASYDYLEPFKYGKAVYFSKGKCGILDTNFNVVLPPIYDFAGVANQNCNKVKKDGKDFLVNNDGTSFIEERFDMVFTEDSLFCIAINFKDEYNEHLLISLRNKKTFRFKNLSSLYKNNYNTLFVAYEKPRDGVEENKLIDIDGNRLIDEPIDGIENFSTGLMLIKKRSYTFYKGDIRNKQVIPLLSRRNLSEIPNSNYYIWYDDSSRMRALLDSVGNTVNGSFYNRIEPFYYTPNSKLICIQNGGKCGLMHFNGKFAFPLQASFVFEQVNIGDTYFKISKNGKYGIFNINGNVMLQPVYTSIHLIDSLKALVLVDSSYVFYNLKMQAFEEEKYQDVNFVSDRIITVKLNGKWGIVNNQGKVVVPFEYDKSMYCYDRGDNESTFFVGVKNNKYGIANLSNKILVPFQYSFINTSWPINGIFMTQSNSKFGGVNLKNEIIIPFIYDRYKTPNSWSLMVVKDGKTGWLNYAGETIIPVEYDDAMFFSGGLAAVKKAGKWGFMDTDFKVVIPYQFDYVEYFTKGKAFVRLNGASFYIDKEGKKIMSK